MNIREMNIRKWAKEFGEAFDKELSDFTNENIVTIYGCKILGGNDKLYFFDDMYNIQPDIKDYVLIQNRDDIALAKVVTVAKIQHNQVGMLSNTPLSGMKQLLGRFNKGRLYKELRTGREVDLDELLGEDND